jgi:hypothetical protein
MIHQEVSLKPMHVLWEATICIAELFELVFCLLKSLKLTSKLCLLITQLLSLNLITMLFCLVMMLQKLKRKRKRIDEICDNASEVKKRKRVNKICDLLF